MNRSALMAPILLIGLSGCGGVTTYEGSYVLVKAPADDEPLRKWVAEQPGVRDVSVTREGKTVRVRYEARLEFNYVTPPFKDLGYEVSGFKGKVTGSNRLVPGIPDWVVLIMAVAAVTTLIEGVKWFVRSRKRAEPRATAVGGRDAGPS
jgi:hypothetical protein